MEVIKKDLKDIEEKIDKNAKTSAENTAKILETMKKLHEHDEQIKKAEGTLEILHTINGGNRRFYAMWLITFISLLASIGFNIFLLIKLLLA